MFFEAIPMGTETHLALGQSFRLDAQPTKVDAFFGTFTIKHAMIIIGCVGWYGFWGTGIAYRYFAMVDTVNSTLIQTLAATLGPALLAYIGYLQLKMKDSSKTKHLQYRLMQEKEKVEARDAKIESQEHTIAALQRRFRERHD